LLFLHRFWYEIRVPVRRSKPSADRILEAAEHVFEKYGYGETSLRQLMAGAGVSTTAFYARFDSKEAVMAALVTRLFGELYEAAPSVLDPTRDLETGIDRGVELLCEQFAPRKALVRMILSEAGSATVAVEARRKAYGVLVAFLAMRVSQFKRKRFSDPTALAWALVGALEIQVVRWAVWNEIEVTELRDQLRASARAVLRMEAP
jgi:AcrR family transcriptional regulator